VIVAHLGIDYANTDHILPPGISGFTKARATGARLIIPRAIFGGLRGPFQDSYWARDKAVIVEAGLNRSAYLFITVPTKANPGTPQPRAQAEAFINYVGNELGPPMLGKRHQSMVPFIDIEMASDVLTADQYYDWHLEVAQILRDYYGAWPGIYTSNRVWIENMKRHAAGKLAACPMWVAKPWPWAPRSPAKLDGAPGWYPTTIPQFGDSTNWMVYQYQGDGLGMPGFTPGAVDMNRVNLVRRGAKGSIVRWIQARAGGLAVDGDFGPLTDARIKALQSSYAIAADGIVGADTWTLLSWLNPAPA
jgi:peptidoglycan hydrolase-like protein with peptidoglycan-binding domain